MARDFATDPEFEEKLDWMRGFVRDGIVPLETLDLDPDTFRRIAYPLEEHKPVDVPTEHIPTRREAAVRKLAQYLDEATANV